MRMEILRISADTLFLQTATAFALCAIACGLIMAGRMTIRRVADSERWPVVPGVILESSVSAVREEGRRRFRPTVRYSYDVDGKRYECNRIQWVAEGFYDPSRPGMAVLQPGPPACCARCTSSPRPPRSIRSSPSAWRLPQGTNPSSACSDAGS